jgi:hypothetical protein
VGGNGIYPFAHDDPTDIEYFGSYRCYFVDSTVFLV